MEHVRISKVPTPEREMYRIEVKFAFRHNVMHIAYISHLNFHEVVARDDNYCLISFTCLARFQSFFLLIECIDNKRSSNDTGDILKG